MLDKEKQLRLLRFKLAQVSSFCVESNPNYSKLLNTKSAYVKTITNMEKEVQIYDCNDPIYWK